MMKTPERRAVRAAYVKEFSLTCHKTLTSPNKWADRLGLQFKLRCASGVSTVHATDRCTGLRS